MSQKSQSTPAAPPQSGDSQRAPIPIGRPGDQQRTPIPIRMPSGQLFGNTNISKDFAKGHHAETESRFLPGSADFAGSHSNAPGIDPPPNSLATPSSHLGQGSFGGGRFATGGWNAPPNTPAQASKLQQMMAGSAQGHSDVPTSSFIEKRTRGMANVSEADEDDPMDQDMDMDDEFSPDCSNQSSFRQDAHHMPSDEPEDMFRME
ncbi:hypothetical protein GGF44_003468 [Coemansia sp. RSA 1694]|nr:hypothetical protein GGF44_003468 [Coemansia sp. RSA 1694]